MVMYFIHNHNALITPCHTNCRSPRRSIEGATYFFVILTRRNRSPPLASITSKCLIRYLSTTHEHLCYQNILQGQYVIHVGEHILTGTCFGPPQAPFGRTSSADFQVKLAEDFHCILTAKLENRLPYSMDSISVWKRTEYVSGKEHEEDLDPPQMCIPNAQTAPVLSIKMKRKRDDLTTESYQSSLSKTDSDVEYITIEQLAKLREKDVNTEKTLSEKQIDFSIPPVDLALLREASLDLQYNEEAAARWAYIPEDERMPEDRAASCISHLLDY